MTPDHKLCKSCQDRPALYWRPKKERTHRVSRVAYSHDHPLCFQCQRRFSDASVTRPACSRRFVAEPRVVRETRAFRSRQPNAA